MTPFPGTKLWEQMKSHKRIALDNFPEDWKYYTLTYPVAKYKHLSMDSIINEMIGCDRYFYSLTRILRRVWDSILQRRSPLITLISSLSYRGNINLNIKSYDRFNQQYGKVK